ncbi:MAG: flagellar biosynthesis anti-sigma factor FlgM [Planctomycetota bacterium]|jgi:anti-sigma28 factor (negative regulator of flagellin synthesis)
MAEITNIPASRISTQPTQRLDRTTSQSPAETAPADTRAARSESDRVELSDHSRLLSQLRSQDVRTDLVYHARSEIADGTYLTQERIDGSIEELARDLDTLG